MTVTNDFSYDPTRADFQAQAFDIYRRLRDEFPLYHDEKRDFWAISRFEDVRNCANDPERLSSEGTSIGAGILPMIQQLDPPRHDELRNLVSTVFTPRRVAAMEPRIRAIARGLIDDFIAAGECDLMAEYARQLPSLVIGDMIGIPSEQRLDFLRATEDLVATPSPEDKGNRLMAAAGEIYAGFTQLLDTRRAQRRDDLMSALIDAEIDGQRLTQDELLGFCFLLVVAGNDTTTNLIASGAVLLARHPDQRRVLVADPSLIPAAAEEMLRFDAPAQALPRIARCDIELHGRTIPKGAEVKLVWAAANRDEREFEDPERFDIRREIKRHLAFGHGLHFCLGANLARLEARVAFEELLARIPEYELASEPAWLTSAWARAYEAVPIRFERGDQLASGRSR